MIDNYYVCSEDSLIYLNDVWFYYAYVTGAGYITGWPHPGTKKVILINNLTNADLVLLTLRCDFVTKLMHTARISASVYKTIYPLVPSEAVWPELDRLHKI